MNTKQTTFLGALLLAASLARPASGQTGPAGEPRAPEARRGFRVPLAGGGSIRVWRDAPRAARARQDGPLLLVDEAFPSVDAVAYDTPTGLEELLWFREDGAPVSYVLDLPAGFHLRRSVRPHVVEVRDGQGRARLRVSAPMGWDAAARALIPALHIDGNRISVGPPPGAALPAFVDPDWVSAGSMNAPRMGHTATLLVDGRVLFAGGRSPEATEDLGPEISESYDPIFGTFTPGAKLVHPRHAHQALVRPDGKVVIVGGLAQEISQEISAGGWPSSPPPEQYDPDAEDEGSKTRGVFSPLGEAPPFAHAPGPAVVLPGGKALVFGGPPGAATTQAATHVYQLDLMTGAYTEAGKLQQARRCFGAVLLDDGRVWIAGGEDEGGKALASTEIHDPATGSATPGAEMPEARSGCAGGPGPLGTALLPGGQVLLTVPSPDKKKKPFLFDPKQGQFLTIHENLLWLGGTPSQGDNLPLLLRSGRVLVLGQDRSHFAFDPILGSPDFIGYEVDRDTSFLGQLERHQPTLTLLPSGDILMAGGTTSRVVERLQAGSRSFSARNYSNEVLLSPWFLRSPARWAGSGADTLLAYSTGNGEEQGISGILRLDPATGLLRMLGPVGWQDDNIGFVRVPGGEFKVFGLTYATLEKFYLHLSASGEQAQPGAADYQSGGVPFSGFAPFDPPTSLLGDADGPVSHEPFAPGIKITGWGLLRPSMALPRAFHAALPLDDKEMLLVGGANTLDNNQSDLLFSLSAERFDVSQQKSDLLPFFLHHPRVGGHRVVGLPGNKALVVGGKDPSKQENVGLPHAELLDLEKKTSTDIPGGMKAARYGQIRTLRLPSGKVLITGGEDPKTPRVFELFDPQTGQFEEAQEAPDAGAQVVGTGSTVTLVEGPSSDALVMDGSYHEDTSAYPRVRVRRFDPQTREIHPLAEPLEPLAEGTAVARLSTGKMLLVGTSAQLFDPATGVRSALIFPGKPRRWATATLLSSGKVLIVGGQALDGGEGKEALADAFLFDSETGGFTALEGGLQQARARHTATLLSSGKVLIAGGQEGAQALASMELFTPGTDAFTAAPAMNRARWGHGAALLRSGDVLLAGGRPVSGKFDGIEVYNPTSERIGLAGESILDAEAVVSALPGGDALIAAGSRLLRYRTASGSVDTSLMPVDHSGGVAAMLPQIDGYMTLCEARVGCRRLPLDAPDTASRNDEIVADSEDYVLKPPGPSLLASARTPRGGVMVLHAPAPGEQRPRIYASSPVPAGTPRPALQTPPKPLRVGQVETLAGERLARVAARGAQALGPRPDLFPLVAWMPENGGGPLFARVSSWTDTSVSFTLPTTAYTGPGFLHVVVGGVPSEGVFAVVQGLATGSACGQDHHCQSDHCADGVCCDTACDGDCMACSQQASSTGQDGTCSPVQEGTSDAACLPGNGEVCGKTGLCAAAGSCRLVKEETACVLGDKSGVCQAGLCLLVARCDSTGSSALSPEGEARSCGTFRCRAGACLETCQGDDDCGEGYRCREERCAAYCEDNYAINGKEEKIDCGTLRCVDGACPAACLSNQDCLQPYICKSGACISGLSTAGQQDPGPCAAGPRGARSSWRVGAWSLAIAWAARRRRGKGGRA